MDGIGRVGVWEVVGGIGARFWSSSCRLLERVKDDLIV